MTPKIFISYQRDSQTIAGDVYEHLKTAGFDVWQDVHNIRHTARWSVEIDHALHDCDRLLLLLTPKSMLSDEVFNEWFFFYNQRKPIHCLMVEQCQPHYQLVPFQYLVWMDADKRDWKRLANELQTPFEWPSVARREKVINSPHAPERTMPEALRALHDAILSDTGAVALTDKQLDDIAKHKPADLTEYRLGRIAEWSQPRYQLDNRFVALTLLIDQGEDAQGVRWASPPENRRYDDLRELLAEHKDSPALVLLGAPGSGKSTLLRRLQLDEAADRLRADAGKTITFFVPLNTYRADSGGALPAPRPWLNAEWKRKYPDLPSLDDLLNAGRVVLLLDALNEMPHKSSADYHERVEAWRLFLVDVISMGNRAVFSCRSLDYSIFLSSKDLRVPQIVVQPMNAEQVREFLDVYTPAHAATIWRELHGSPQFDLFRTPFFLKLLVDLVDAAQRISQGTAGLFTGFVRQALMREISGGSQLLAPNGLLDEHDHRKLNQAKWRTPYELPERGALMPSLTQLAFTMQTRGLQTEGAQVRVDYDEACDLIGHNRGADILKAGTSLNVLDEDIARDEITFFHQLLQEFFAARQLAAHPNHALVRVEWRADEVTPSLAETLAQIADSDPLPPPSHTGWEETTILAAAMCDDPDVFVRALLDHNVPLAGRCAAAAEVTITAKTKRAVQDALIARTQDDSADLRARISAGLALGDLGDPRFERRNGPHGDYLLPPLVTIPAGTYLIGDDNGNHDNQKPQHPVTLESFQIGVFPVTNAEYALFLAAGGYDDERWWETDEARAWRRGEGTAEGSRKAWRDNRATLQSWTDEFIRGLATQGRVTSQQADDYITSKYWSDERFESWLEERFPDGRHTQPLYWDDTTFNNPAQPVVGICWHEARAYCAWITANLTSQSLLHTMGWGNIFRLSTEAEWEAAARGLPRDDQSPRSYAYGQTFDVIKGNTFESHIRRTTSVGIYSGGATPDGIYDLVGNVWEWTSTSYDQEYFPYPYRLDDGREMHSNVGRRVMRGGSWEHDQSLARAAFRPFHHPNPRNDNVGFRLVLARPISAL